MSKRILSVRSIGYPLSKWYVIVLRPYTLKPVTETIDDMFLWLLERILKGIIMEEVGMQIKVESGSGNCELLTYTTTGTQE
jgi:hypothetical protein